MRFSYLSKRAVSDNVKEVEPASERTSSLTDNTGSQIGANRATSAGSSSAVRTSLVTGRWAQLQSRNKAAHTRV